MRLRTLLFIAFLITSLFLAKSNDVRAASPNGKKTTPYGAYCDRVRHYGNHHKALNDKHVNEALKHYYGEKDLDFKIINSKGRFVKAFIKDGNKIVDTIILDRRTGRIRSVY